jgi:hypothetical protein
LIHMAFTMACPNFKKGLKMVSGPLGVNVHTHFSMYEQMYLNELHQEKK